MEAGGIDSPFDVVELRVHGVGGATPEGLLGVAERGDTATVADDGMAGFHARRADPRVEGYVWGNLTQKPLLQPLWLLLLPFTLVNVAGWMHPPRHLFRPWGEKTFWLFRLTAWGVGIGLTAIYVFWPGRIVINLVYGMERGRWPAAPHARILLAACLMALFMLLVAGIAGYRQSKFERYEAPSMVTTRAVAGKGTRRAFHDPLFWAQPVRARILLAVHVLFALACVGLMAFAAWNRAPSRFTAIAPPHLNLVQFPIRTTEIVLIGVALLGLLQWVLWTRPKEFWSRPGRHVGFRWFGPAIAASTGVSLGTELFYGISLRFFRGDPETKALGVAFGFGALTLGAATVVFGIWLVLRRAEEMDAIGNRSDPRYVAPNNPPERIASEQPIGATDAVRKRIATSRALSEAGRNADLLLFAPAPVFIASALWQLSGRASPQPSWVGDLGVWISSAGAVVVLGFLIHRSRKPGERKIVGTIWDVLTFWPRRFHPFAVRPYAERAVPELQRRLLFHIAGPRPPGGQGDRKPHHPARRVILSCHSQGTVLGYAAFVQLPEAVRDHIAFVTYGAPLRQLHQMAFPAYFDQDGFRELRASLWAGTSGSGLPWRSFYRQTDYIGKRVFEADGIDTVVPDPAERPQLAENPIPTALPRPYPDPARSIWVELARHSFYNREEVLKETIAELKAAMR